MNKKPSSSVEKRALLAKLLRQKVDEKESYSLSFGQERMWFLEQLDPGNPGLNLPIAIRLVGEVNQNNLEQSLNHVVGRHDTLRTSFCTEQGQPVQVVAPTVMVPLTEVDLQGNTLADREIEAQRLAAQETGRPFDLTRAPLLRATLLKLDQKEYLLLLTMHHIVSDAHSMPIFTQELMSHYGALVRGKPPTLPEFHVQYKRFVEWQRQQAQGEAYRSQLAHWQKLLAGAPTEPLLPTDRPRRPTKGLRFQAAYHEFGLSRRLTRSLWEFSQAEGVTPFVTLLTAFKSLLHRYSGRHDILVGVPTINRSLPEFANLIGFCANTLVLRSDLHGNPTFRALLQAVRQTTLDAYGHQDVPFEKLMESVQQGSDREDSYAPLFQVQFNLLKGMQIEANEGGLTWKTEGVPMAGTYYDLWVLMTEHDGLRGVVFYNADIFEKETIAQLFDVFQEMLERVVTNPETRISDFDLPKELETKKTLGIELEGKQTMAISATFTSEPVEESLAFWLQKMEVPARIEFAPYNQVFQALLNPTSVLASNRSGVNVILLRMEDWWSQESPNAANQFEQNAEDLIAAVKTSVLHSSMPHLICFCPHSPGALAGPVRAEIVYRVEKRLSNELIAVDGVHVVTTDEINGLYPCAYYYDAHQDELGHIPYTPVFFSSLGTMIARKIHTMLRKPYKVIVLDCDQTLWEGVCAEDGPLGVRINSAHKALQAFMIKQHESGMLLCLCSKNNERDVMAVFEERTEMILKREHLVSWRINWRSKSENLKSLAEELQLGLDSFIFIDDNAIECAEVKNGLPEVLTLELPREASSIARFLTHVWAFDRLTITEEDRKRADLYRQNVFRERSRKEHLTLREFLDGLELNINIEVMKPHEMARVAQLTQRTNQFNLTTVRRSENEIQRLIEQDGFTCLVAEVSDRFGDYGLVGVVLYYPGAGAIHVDTFLLSCRALGRGVEHQMLSKLGEIAVSRGIEYVEVLYSATERNQPALAFLESVGMAFGQPMANGYRFRFPASVAIRLVYDPSTIQPVASPGEQRVRSSSALTAPSTLMNWIATEMQEPQEILKRIEGQKQQSRFDVSFEYVQPRTPTEKRVSQIWSEVLRIDKVGIHDNFFRLGGHSMLGTLLMSRVREAFRVDVPLSVLFDAPTVEGLAKAIELWEIQEASAEELAEALEEMSAVSDNELEALLTNR